MKPDHSRPQGKNTIWHSISSHSQDRAAVTKKGLKIKLGKKRKCVKDKEHGIKGSSKKEIFISFWKMEDRRTISNLGYWALTLRKILARRSQVFPLLPAEPQEARGLEGAGSVRSRLGREVVQTSGSWPRPHRQEEGLFSRRKDQATLATAGGRNGTQS